MSESKINSLSCSECLTLDIKKGFYQNKEIKDLVENVMVQIGSLKVGDKKKKVIPQKIDINILSSSEYNTDMNILERLITKIYYFIRFKVSPDYKKCFEHAIALIELENKQKNCSQLTIKSIEQARPQIIGPKSSSYAGVTGTQVVGSQLTECKAETQTREKREVSVATSVYSQTLALEIVNEKHAAIIPIPPAPISPAPPAPPPPLLLRNSKKLKSRIGKESENTIALARPKHPVNFYTELQARIQRRREAAERKTENAPPDQAREQVFLRKSQPAEKLKPVIDSELLVKLEERRKKIEEEESREQTSKELKAGEEVKEQPSAEQSAEPLAGAPVPPPLPPRNAPVPPLPVDQMEGSLKEEKNPAKRIDNKVEKKVYSHSDHMAAIQAGVKLKKAGTEASKSANSEKVKTPAADSKTLDWGAIYNKINLVKSNAAQAEAEDDSEWQDDEVPVAQIAEVRKDPIPVRQPAKEEKKESNVQNDVAIAEPTEPLVQPYNDNTDLIRRLQSRRRFLEIDGNTTEE